MAPTMSPAVARFSSSLMMLRSVECSSQASEDLSCIHRRKPRREAGTGIVARVPGRWTAVERPSRPQDGGVDALARERGQAVPLAAGQSSGGIPELLADGRQPDGPPGEGLRRAAGGGHPPRFGRHQNGQAGTHLSLTVAGPADGRIARVRAASTYRTTAVS